MTTAKEIMSTDFPRLKKIECDCNRPDCAICDMQYRHEHDSYCLCPSCRIKKYEEEHQKLV